MLPPSVSVVVALPAGSLKRLPLAVALRSPDAVVSCARSLGNGTLSRSVQRGAVIEVGVAGDGPAAIATWSCR